MTASNTWGKQTVVPLTNKSGGGVIAGDVVVVDTGNNDAFTTSTAGAFTGLVGVAQETIASNATGRVLLGGYAALVNVNASVTRGNYGKTHTVAKQATDAGATRTTGTFVQFLTGGTTPDGNVFNPDLGTGGSTIITKDEGSTLSSSVTTLDFVGAGVTASGAGATTTVTIPGGGISHSYIGYNTIGGTTESITQYRAFMKKVTLASAGLITSIGVYLKQTTIDAVIGVNAVVWEDNAGSPRYVLGADNAAQIIWLQDAAGVAGSARWYHSPIGLYCPAGDYWIGVQLDSAGTYQVYKDGSGGDRYYTASGSRILDAGRLTVTTTTDKYSIRASLLS